MIREINMEIGQVKNYLVKFTFEIPVKVVGNTSEEEAYFKARDEFYDFSINEADVKIESIEEDDYKKRREIIDKQHDDKWYGSKE